MPKYLQNVCLCKTEMNPFSKHFIIYNIFYNVHIDVIFKILPSISTPTVNMNELLKTHCQSIKIFATNIYTNKYNLQFFLHFSFFF
jgi:hypothetical protein